MNVILVVFDSLRADHVGCYGNTWIKTPNIDNFAQENVLFTKAAPESLPTIQARRAMLTGNRLFPFRDWKPKLGDNVISPGWAPFRESDITLSEILLDAGYRTAFITDTYHMFKASMNFHRGFKEWRWIRGQEYDQYRSAPLPKDIDIDHFIHPKLHGTYAHAKLLQYLSNTSFRKSEADWFSPMVFTEGMRWMEEGDIRCENLLTHRFPLEAYRQAFSVAVDKRKHRSVKVAFDFAGATLPSAEDRAKAQTRREE